MANGMGRPRARFCKYGHDTHKYGRDQYSKCMACRQERNEKPPLPTYEDVMRDVAEMRARVRARSGHAA